MGRLHLFILLFVASSLLFQLPPEAFAIDPSDIAVIDTAIDGDEFTELGTAIDVATFTIDSSTYAIVIGHDDDGVQIIDISDPANIVATDAETDGVNGFTELDGGVGVDTFTIGSSTYAIIVSQDDNGVQIIDISDPANIVATDAETHGENGFTRLMTPSGVATFTIGSNTYAIVTSLLGIATDTIGSVTIIDISDPANINETDFEVDEANGFTELHAASGVDTFVIGSSTYAIVTSVTDDGVQIINISDPANIVANDAETDGENGFTELDGAAGVATFTIGSSTYAIVVNDAGDGVQIIDISDPANIVAKDAETDGVNGFTELDGAEFVTTFTINSSTYAIVTSSTDDGIQIIDISDPANIVAKDAETDGVNGFTLLDSTTGVATFTIGSSTYAIVASFDDDAVTIIGLGNASDGGSSTCARLVILGNCGTIAINNDEYQIIDPWSTIPTTEVMVGDPVSITLSTPHNYAVGKINSVSVYTEIFGSPTNYEQGAHIGYSIMSDKYSVSKANLFQVAAATHRIVQDPDVKNLEMFEVVFTMIFAKPMDTSHVVIETKNMHGISETIYLGNALKVIERPIELLTYEEKSKFEIISEPELKASLRPDMDIEPNMGILAIDPEPVVSKATCGNGTMLKDNLCVANEMSFYFFVNQFMRFFG
jgi:hypothetical protein